MHARKRRNLRGQFTTRYVTRSTFKLKELHVVLHDIAVYPEIVPLQHRQSFNEQLKRITRSSYIRKPKNLFNDIIQLSGRKVRRSNERNNTSAENSPLSSISVQNERKRPITRRKLKKDIESKVWTDDDEYEVIQRKPIKYKRLHIIDSDESSDTTNYQTSTVIRR